MKSILVSVILATAAMPVLSFAQPHDVTPAQVASELVQLEKAGYDPSQTNQHYPDNLQAAEAKVAAQQSAVASPAATPSDTQTSGHPSHLPEQSIYFGD